MYHFDSNIEKHSRTDLVAVFDECYAVYQPVWDTLQKKVFYFEALLRHHDIKTASIINSCAYHNLWSELFMSMVKNVINVGKAIDAPISINVSPSQVYNGTKLFQTLNNAVEDGLNLSNLILEVTENEPISDPINFRESAAILNNMGVKLSLDDFGSCFSSIDALKIGGFKHVKIDRSLISGICYNTNSQASLAELIKYCGDSGLHLIAEGVEYNEEIKYLQSVNINIMQGYFFSKPISADALKNIYS